MNDKKLSRAARHLLHGILFEIKDECESIANDFSVNGPSRGLRNGADTISDVVDEICNFCGIEQDKNGFPLIRNAETEMGDLIR